jgi:hypothetical protein
MIQESRPLLYLIFVETYLNLRGAVEKGPSRLGTTY